MSKKILECNRQIADVSYENVNPDDLPFCEESHLEKKMFVNRLCSKDAVIRYGRSSNKMLSADSCANNMEMW